ncbi:MAG: hypothetical protein SV775_16585 [Thermodesulfobacteriota bacterium]|nr:hypothetical protein [Thermodesulfobacteriota bacterium]
MIAVVRNVWDILGSITLSIWILIAVACDAVIGSAVFQIYRPVFSPLNHLMLQDWIAQYGFKNLSITWWIFLFMFLLFLLGINIFVCTTNRVVILARQHSPWLLFAPHIMHYAFILLLLGHLSSFIIGFNSHGVNIEEGQIIPVPHSEVKIKLEDLNIEYEKGGSPSQREGNNVRLGQQGVREVSAILWFIRPDDQTFQKKVIGIPRPVWHDGLSFHINSFYPKTEKEPGTPSLSLIIRKDPGIKVMMAGATVFTVGLFMYLFQMIKANVKNHSNRGHRNGIQ